MRNKLILCLATLAVMICVAGALAAEQQCLDGPDTVGVRWAKWRDDVLGINWNNQGFVACSAERYCKKWGETVCGGMKNKDRWNDYVERCKDTGFNTICGRGTDHSKVQYCICDMHKETDLRQICDDKMDVANDAFRRKDGRVPKPVPYDPPTGCEE